MEAKGVCLWVVEEKKGVALRSKLLQAVINLQVIHSYQSMFWWFSLLPQELELPEDVLDLVRRPLLLQWVVSMLFLLLAVLVLIALCCVLVTLYKFSCHKPSNRVTTIFTKTSLSTDERRPPQPVLTLARNLYPHPSWKRITFHSEFIGTIRF